MTMRYAHLVTDHLHRAMSKMDAASRAKVGTATAVFDSASSGRDQLQT